MNYKMQQIEETKKIRNSYRQNEPTKLDQLRKLDGKVKRPAEIFAYSFGAVGSLVLGVGMCLAMGVIGSSMTNPIGMVLGVVIGVVGIAMASFNYLLYKLILKKNKNKYCKQVLDLSDEILNETKN